MHQRLIRQLAQSGQRSAALHQYDVCRRMLAKELGDVLWYIATLSTELGLDLEEIAAGNLAKLSARKDAGKIHGSGDLR